MSGDRDRATGQFASGNTAAVGRSRPHAAQVAELRTALLDAATPDRPSNRGQGERLESVTQRGGVTGGHAG